MIGQMELLRTIDDMIDDDIFPRFSVIQGVDGSGKSLVVEHIKEQLNDSCMVVMNNSVDSVRNAMERAYATTIPLVFYFPDADIMSQSAKNALLKITEEPPNKAYFILTVVNEDSLPNTIRSRATIFRMEPYSPMDLSDYMYETYSKESDEFIKLAYQICDNPGEINLLHKNGASALWMFVNKVMNNIAEVSVSNALKIADKIAFKDEDEEGKFNLTLFWKSVIVYCCIDLADKTISTEELRVKARVVMSTKDCIDMITKVRGANKRNAFDIWLLDVRDILGEEYGSN